MTYIDDQIRARIAAAAARRQRRRRDRQELAEAREHGLPARHAAKLQRLDHDQDDDHTRPPTAA